MIIFFIGYFLFFGCIVSDSTSQIKSGWEEMNLKGEVKLISKRTYKFTPEGKGERDISNHAYLLKSGLIYDYDIEFDQQGNKLKHSYYKTYIRDPNDTIKWNYYFEYDHNKCTKESQTNQNGVSLKERVFKYDAQGRKIKINKESKYTASNNYWTFEYDNNGYLVKEFLLDGYKEFKYKYEYENNKIGLKTRAQKFIYDDRKREWTPNDWKEFSYNKLGQLIQLKEYIKDGRLEGKYKYIYDNYSNIIQENKFIRNDEIGYQVNFEYEYDDNENWIKSIVKKNNSNIYIVERDIKYW